MASVTAVAALSSNQPRTPVIGNVTRVFSVVGSATMSSGDTWLMPWARIPHGATIVDVRLSGKTMDGINVITPFVRVGSTDQRLGSLSLSAAGRYGATVYTQTSAGETAWLPFTVSVSDDAATRHGYMGFSVDATSASQSTSCSLSILITYTMDR